MQTTYEFTKSSGEPRLEDIHPAIAYVDNVWVRQIVFPKAGDKNLPHRHDTDHMTLLASGSIRATVNDIEQDFVAPCMIMVHADFLHHFTALVDNTVAYCVHAKRDGYGQVVDPTMVPDGALTQEMVYKYELANPAEEQFTIPAHLSKEERKTLFFTITFVYRRFDVRARLHGFTDFAQALALQQATDPAAAAQGLKYAAYEAECKRIIQQLLDDIREGKRTVPRSHREVINDFPVFPVKAPQ